MDPNIQPQQPDDHASFIAELEATHGPHEFEMTQQQCMADAPAKALTALEE